MKVSLTNNESHIERDNGDRLEVRRYEGLFVLDVETERETELTSVHVQTVNEELPEVPQVAEETPVREVPVLTEPTLDERKRHVMVHLPYKPWSIERSRDDSHLIEY